MLTQPNPKKPFKARADAFNVLVEYLAVMSVDDLNTVRGDLDRLGLFDRYKDAVKMCRARC